MKNEKVKIKEELYIKWEIPTLNEQLRQLELSNSSRFFFVSRSLYFIFLLCFSYCWSARSLLFPMYFNIEIVKENFIAKFYNVIIDTVKIQIYNCRTFATEDDIGMSNKQIEYHNCC